ncbi:DUF4054 domain-containing protein [Serratia nevei]|uniref:DUF4054 domain-containing protein n=1 Tax=Serratia nevei TaxID=2703794 RepID=UPI003FA743A3
MLYLYPFMPPCAVMPRPSKNSVKITPHIVADFRAYYPAFANADLWPEDIVIRALEEADAETGPRWLKYRAKPASIKARGMYAYAAHRLLMWKRAEEEEDAGAMYAVSSKSVGDESTSFAVPSVSSDDLILNGDLPMTQYGVEFLRLRRRASAGPAIV